MNPSATIARAAARAGTTVVLARMGSAAAPAIPCTAPVPYRQAVAESDGIEVGDMSIWVEAGAVAQAPLPDDLATVASSQYVVQGVTTLEYQGTQGYELQLRRRA